MKHLHTVFSKIQPADKCLLIFMIILLIQSAYSLLLSPVTTPEGAAIDVIIRTSISAIFGYFLSVNFMRHFPSEKGDDEIVESTEVPKPVLRQEKSPNEHLQIGIAAVIGLFCLVVLIILRDVYLLLEIDLSSSFALATISQFRDLVSGCVGFLIGCPTTGEKNH